MPTEAVNENPYSAPVAFEIPAESSGRVNISGLRIRWCVVVAVNLPVPLFLGMTSASGLGKLGMPLGIAVVAIAGLLLCTRSPQMMSSLCRGAVLTALSQFYPILHMVVGMCAIGICSGSDGPRSGMTGVFQVTMATLITGVGLIVPSLFAGVIITVILKWFAPKVHKSDLEGNG